MVNQPLNNKYISELEGLIEKMQDSEELKLYLEEEEEVHYKKLLETFEPLIEKLHTQVAANSPLQLVEFEKRLLDDRLEGLFLPRILGYSVLRGWLNENYKYTRPQSHFNDILIFIVNNPNFEYIKQRTGQSIQIGFALSSDIWVTNFINKVGNKKIVQYLQNLVTVRLRDLKIRKNNYSKYQKQFEHFNYKSISFPETVEELRVTYNEIVDFLLYRQKEGYDHTGYILELNTLISKSDFTSEKEFAKVIYTVVNFIEYDSNFEKFLSQQFNNLRKKNPKFADWYFDNHIDFLQKGVENLEKQDNRVYGIMDLEIKDNLLSYYVIMQNIHTVGFMHEDTIHAIREFYNTHEGLSVINECLMLSVLNFFKQVVNRLHPEDYTEYFEFHKTFATYMDIFFNEKFNHQVRALSFGYVKKLLKHFTDKRGRDYQDIKKFVLVTFDQLGFMSPKELKALFVTKRKKKVTS